jgi:hypothetical protein
MKNLSEPTYSLKEVINLIWQLDFHGLQILCEVVMEEKYCYSIVELEVIRSMVDVRRMLLPQP